MHSISFKHPLASSVLATLSSRVFVTLIIIAVANATNVGSAFAMQDESEAERAFTLKVLPLIQNKCFGCHGNDPDDLKGELDMRTRDGLLYGGESGEAAIIPGDPENSVLLHAIRWEGYEMPPKETDRLTDDQIQIVHDWIQAEAPWPDADTQDQIRREEWAVIENEDGIIVSTSGGLADEWTYRRYKPEDIWAFKPIQLTEPPESDRPGINPIDAFVEHRVRAAGLELAPQADPHTLIRRAYFDLIGLPPTPSDIDEFVTAWEQDSNVAWNQLIDRLLDSPQYGERWGQHWLDVARYADTSGFSNDWERSNAWRFRDYVIRSLNEDKPFNQFIIEQVAGDEVAAVLASDPELQMDVETLANLKAAITSRLGDDFTLSKSEGLIAAGFLRMGPWEHTPMNPIKESRQQFLDDVVNGIGQTFLSTPLRCCKCHDHKFDPIPTRDYYRFYAALATTQPAERPAEYLEIEDRSSFEENRQIVQELLDFATQERDKLYEKREAAAKAWYEERGRGEEYVGYQKRLALRNVEKPARFEGLTPSEQGILKVREQDVRIWTRRLERFQPLVQSVYNGGDPNQNSIRLRLPNRNNQRDMNAFNRMPETSIYAGGSVFSPTDTVSPGVLSCLEIPAATGTEDSPYDLPSSVDGRRLALSLWIADPDNALATRSIVNRLWHYHFGQGIAGNPNNFGATGKHPTHPALLDWLANHFVDHGWSFKNMHRLIMTSDAYMRDSNHPEIDKVRTIDPNNQLLAVFEPRRLSAEEIRDSMLSVSGELNLAQGGLPIRPEINMEVALAPRMIQFSLAPAWQPSRSPDERNRRSIYAYQVRGLPNPLLEVFNKPGSDESCEFRDSSSVTPQVFTMLNSTMTNHRSIALALRVQKASDSPSEQIAMAYKLAIGDSPSSGLLENLADHYDQMVAYHKQHEPERLEYPSYVTRSLVEEFTGDAFEYEEYLNIFEDYESDVQASDVGPETRALADVCLLLFNSNAFVFVY